jgi:hypothetical protein
LTQTEKKFHLTDLHSNIRDKLVEAFYSSQESSLLMPQKHQAELILLKISQQGVMIKYLKSPILKRWRYHQQKMMILEMRIQ